MVPIKPHAVTVALVAQTPDPQSIVNNPVAGAASGTIYGCLQQMSPRESYDRFGVSLDDVFEFYCEIADAGSFAPNALVYSGSAQFSVMGNPAINQFETELDHAVIYVRRLQYKDPNS